MKLKLSILPDMKPVKQTPRRFAPEVTLKIKEEIERILRNKLIRTARYVEWLENIVPLRIGGLCLYSTIEVSS